MHAILSLSALMAFALPLMSHPVNEGLNLTSPNPAHVKRQGGRQWGYAPRCEYTKIVSDKKADLIHHWQVSENLECGKGDCAVAEIEQHTFGIEAGGEVTGGVFGAGVGLTSEWTNGNSYECSGEEGETICVWARAEYAVYDVAATQTCSPPDGEGLIIEAKIPKEDGRGMYCVRGPCRGEDHHYWQTL